MKNKYFEQKNFVKNYIYAITIFIITLVIGISIFFNVVQASVEKNSRETLITNVTQQSKHLNTILNINYSYLNVLAQELSKSKSKHFLYLLSVVLQSCPFPDSEKGVLYILYLYRLLKHPIQILFWFVWHLPIKWLSPCLQE